MSLLIYTLIASVVFFIIYWVFFKNSSETDDKPEEEENDIGMEDGKPQMLILYGSQTGTAEEFANTLASDARKYGFNSIAKDMVDFEPSELPTQKFVVFVVATYGEGEPTDNARDFYEYIKDSSNPNDLLAGVKYAVFGLGNKQYKLYQAMGRYFDKRIKELGAEQVFREGEGDADADIDEDFEEWKSQFLVAASEVFETEVRVEDDVYQPKFKTNYSVKEQTISAPYKTSTHSPDAKHPFLSTILKNVQLLNNPGTDNRSTLHVEFDIKGSGIRYEAGDHLAVCPQNEESLVKAYMKRLGVTEEDIEKPLQLRNVKDNRLASYFPRDTFTLKFALTYYLDLNAIAKKKALNIMANFAKDEQERDRLRLLAGNSQEGKVQYHGFIKEECRNVLDVLNQFKSVDLPIESFVELMPKLQVRYYSIASSSQLHQDSICAVVAVVRFKTSSGTAKEGVCSSYLERLKEGQKAYIYVRHSNFHLPHDPKTPVIMVGPGTGVAPFIGFLEQRTAMNKKGIELGECQMYFGCRKKSEDYIFGDMMENSVKTGVITQLEVAFSRDQEQKVYVQNKVEANSEKIWNLLQKGGYFYICGDAKHMAKDVENVLLSSIQKYGNMTSEEAVKYLDKLSNEHRYQLDVWSG